MTRGQSWPVAVDCLVGDSSNAKTDLGWEPRHSFQKLIKLMLGSDWLPLAAEPRGAR